MFDFENLIVYQKAKAFNRAVQELQAGQNFDKSVRDQLRRASLSIQLNIAEGSGKFTSSDRCKFLIIARGSVYESISLLESLLDEKQIDAAVYREFYGKGEEISKILFAMIRNLKEGRV